MKKKKQSHKWHIHIERNSIYSFEKIWFASNKNCFSFLFSLLRSFVFVRWRFICICEFHYLLFSVQFLSLLRVSLCICLSVCLSVPFHTLRIQEKFFYCLFSPIQDNIATNQISHCIGFIFHIKFNENVLFSLYFLMFYSLVLFLSSKRQSAICSKTNRNFEWYCACYRDTNTNNIGEIWFTNCVQNKNGVQNHKKGTCACLFVGRNFND